jgi:hypothetical protein
MKEISRMERHLEEQVESLASIENAEIEVRPIYHTRSVSLSLC